MIRRNLLYGILPLFLLTALLPAGALGTKEEPERTYTGRAVVKGSEPHTRIVLVTEEADYALTGPLAEKIRADYQGYTLVVAGEIRKEALGPGFPAELEVTEILEVN